MHPAYSVILVTTASGAGYGLLVWLGVLSAIDALPADRWFGFAGLALSLGLISVGLLASTFHLGHPERAWRAFLQWRSSWLSREGAAAVATYVPAGLFGIGWVLFERTDSIFALFGLIAALTLLEVGLGVHERQLVARVVLARDLVVAEDLTRGTCGSVRLDPVLVG